MKRILAIAGILALTLTGCGGGTDENRTATGEDAEYVQELIELSDAYEETPDADLIEMADSFCYILGQAQTPSNAMRTLYGSMNEHDAAMYAMTTASTRCPSELYGITNYLGY